MRQQNIQLQVKQLYLEFRGLLYKTKSKQTQFWREAHLLPFLEKIQKGLDIGTTDKNYLSKMEEKYGVKMTEEDTLYREDQMSGSRKMYCQSFADKRWLITVERRRHEEERLAARKEKDTSDQASLFTKVAVPDEVDGLELDDAVEGEDNFEENVEDPYHL